MSDGNFGFYAFPTGPGAVLPAAAAKGTIAVYNGSIWTILAPGANGTVLSPDSTQPTGLNYITVAGTGTVTSVTAGAGLSATPNPIVGIGSILATPAFLIPVRCLSKTDITVASPGATIDGIAMSAGDRVLLTAQSTGSQNGVWVWNGAAVSMTRPVDFASGSTVLAYQNQFVWVAGGAFGNGSTFWSLGTSGTVTIDATTQSWNQITIAESSLSLISEVILNPASSTRNIIQPTGDFNNLILRGSVGQTSKLISLQNSGTTEVFGVGVGGGTTASGAITSTAGLILSQKDGGTAVIQGKAWGTGNYVYMIGSSARGTQALPTATQDADNLMVFGGRGYPNVAFDSGVFAFKAVGAHSATAAGASASIFTTPSGTLAQQQSLLLSDVGIITQLAINATTNATDDLITANHRSTGTPAAGFGNAIRFLGQSASVIDRNMGRLRTVWNVATDASRTADLYGTASDSGGDRDGWRVRADGTGAIFDVLAGQRHAVRVVTAAGAVTVTNQDYTIEVNKTVGAATAVNLPTGVAGQIFCIKDGKGDANVNNITVTPAAGNIDNAATYVINTAKGGAMVQYDGTMWIVLCKI